MSLLLHATSSPKLNPSEARLTLPRGGRGAESAYLSTDRKSRTTTKPPSIKTLREFEKIPRHKTSNYLLALTRHAKLAIGRTDRNWRPQVGNLRVHGYAECNSYERYGRARAGTNACGYGAGFAAASALMRRLIAMLSAVLVPRRFYPRNALIHSLLLTVTLVVFFLSPIWCPIFPTALSSRWSRMSRP